MVLTAQQTFRVDQVLPASWSSVCSALPQSGISRAHMQAVPWYQEFKE
jgi:hypothetical protein